MSVAQIGQLHTRYVRLSDKFKTVWTYNQFAGGVYKNILHRPLPYKIDFQKLFDEIRKAGDVIQSANSADATPLMESAERALQKIFAELVDADAEIGASILRRFFEKLRTQDEKIIFNLIKFYLYAGTRTGEQRDKLDFLFTRIAEEFIEERGEYTMKDSSELKRVIQGLVTAAQLPALPEGEANRIIGLFRAVRDEVLRSSEFDHLTDSNLLGRSRELKNQIGDAFWDPDVMLAIIDSNITTKNRFARLYRDEEYRIVEDARRLMENEQAIARGFGESNPELLGEMSRFKQFKEVFDKSRADSNVKHNLIAQLKSSMSNILTQLDKGLDADEVEELSDSFFIEAEQSDDVMTKFGDDPLLQPYLVKMISVLDSFDADETSSRMLSQPAIKNLRLESWEISSYQKLYWNHARHQGETDDLLLLFLRSAALRLRIDEEARVLADIKSGTPTKEQLKTTQTTLDRAKEFDETFKEYLQAGIYSNPKNIHRLYRSRLRLLRAYSGLWLIYDQFAVHDE